MNYLQENIKMSKKENLKHISNVKLSAQQVFSNIFVNNQTTENDMKLITTPNDLRMYNLFLIKNYLYEGCIYGLFHVQVKFFKKERNYDNHIKIIKEKISKTLEISRASNKNEGYVLVDLRGMTAKQFSRKFVKLIADTLDDYPDEILKTCYVYGNSTFIKLMWPLIKSFVKKETKEKLVLLS